jgi:hypothetical protein
MLSRGWIELYICQEPLTNESVQPVPPEERSKILASDASWEIPEPHGKSVRWGTTEEGFEAYKVETGWSGYA